jgi:transcriptional regulator with XRE-family HTH domain
MSKDVRPFVVAPVGTRIRTPGQIGSIISGYRHAAGLTQKELAEKVFVSRQWIAEIERGKVRAEIGLIMHVLAVLNVPLGIVEESKEPDLIEEVLRRAKARSMGQSGNTSNSR